MILYELRCGAGHGFEAWFRNSDTYDQQRAAEQIYCPVCGGGGVSKAPMAPRIGRSGGKSRDVAVPEPSRAPTADTAPPTLSAQDHEKMRMVLSKIAELNRHIADTCDYVGGAFAEEARKIHYGESEERHIYGEATIKEAKELIEEGVDVAPLPPDLDSAN